MNTKIIRLKPKGRLYLHKFDLVVCYKHKRSRGDSLEKIGFFNPSGKRAFLVNLQRLGYWMNRGAIIHSNVRKRLAKLVIKT
jgi:ribosomal protein S16